MRAVNLIPTDQRKGGAVGAAFAGRRVRGAGVAGGRGHLDVHVRDGAHQAESRKPKRRSYRSRGQVQSEAAQLTPYTSFMQMREQRLQTIAQLINSRFDWSSAMGELSRVLPRGVSLSSLEATIAAPASSAATPRPPNPQPPHLFSSSSVPRARPPLPPTARRRRRPPPPRPARPRPSRSPAAP